MLNDQDLHNFADDNTLSAVGETIQGLVDIMQHKAESAISWMEENDMIANADKFKALSSLKIDSKLKTMNLILRVNVSLHLQKLICWA